MACHSPHRVDLNSLGVSRNQADCSQPHVHTETHLFWLDPIFDLQRKASEILIAAFSAFFKTNMENINMSAASEMQELFLLSLSFIALSVLFSFTPSSVSAWK